MDSTSRQRRRDSSAPKRPPSGSSSPSSSHQSASDAAAAAAVKMTPATAKKREFGDHMAPENTTYSHVNRIVWFFYALLLGFSIFASKVTGDPWWGQVLFYAITLFLFCIWHRLAHQPWTGRMYLVHYDHHYVKFPPSCYYGKPGVVKSTYGYDCPTFMQLANPLRWLPGANGEASNDVNGAIFHEGPLIGMLLLVLLFQKFVLNHSNGTLGFCLFQALFIAVVGSALHSSFHVKGFELERFDWYKELRTYHYIHHLGTTKHNYALMNIGLVDGVMNTLRLSDPNNVAGASSGDKADKSDEQIVLPDKISWHELETIKNNFGSLTLRILLSEDHNEVNTSSIQWGSSRRNRGGGVKTMIIRILMVGVGFWFWFRGASFMMSLSNPIPSEFSLQIDDFGHKITTPLLQIFKENGYLQILKNFQHFLTDCGMIYILSSTLFGESTVCVLSGLLALSARSILLFLTPVIPMSSVVEKIDLTVLPKFFGNGDELVNSTHFISLHIIVAVIVFMRTWSIASLSSELSSTKQINTALLKQWCLLTLAALVLVTEILISLTLRENWSLDVCISVTLAVYCFNQAESISPSFDYVRSL